MRRVKNMEKRYAGYAEMGLGKYVLQNCKVQRGAEDIPCLVVRHATVAEKIRRVVGDLEDTPAEEVGVPMDPKIIVMQFDFVTERGLFALEQQLQILRDEFFPGTMSGSVRVTGDLSGDVELDDEHPLACTLGML